MKGDFSRDTFDLAKHFSRVLMQQGRVQLDADSNEQTAILLHYLRTLAADLIGPFAGPAGADWGFEIIAKVENDLSIGQGRYYVDGILCENDAPAATYNTQKDFPKPPSLETIQKCLVYLDVWERHLTALENDDIREKALGGADTASRAQVVWQVKVETTSPTDSPTDPTPKNIRKEWANWIKIWQPPHLGCLKARVIPSQDSTDPCLTAPDSRYRGQENQLYRVEIHQAGKAGTATFKWSRDNGAIATSCVMKGTELIAGNPRGFAANQWVELINDGQELRGDPGTLVKVIKVEGDRLTLEKVVSKPDDLPADEDWPKKVRRWDQNEKGRRKLINGAVPVDGAVSDTEWFELEDGIQIQFLPSADKGNPNYYRAGDYWLIPARVQTGNIEWPVELENNGRPTLDVNGYTIPIPTPPLGIRHHYAPLATLTKVAGGWEVKDCRCFFQTLLNDRNIVSHGEEGMGGTPVCSSG
jgi:hypothetical protein